MTGKATGTFTVGNGLKVADIRYGDREAIFCSTTGRRFTFSELNTRTNGLANGLTDLGLKKGDVAAFLCTNRAEIVETYYALAKTGIVGLPLNYRLSTLELTELMSHCETQALVFDPLFSEIAGEIKEKLPQIRTVVGMGDDPPDFAVGYEELVAGSNTTEPDAQISEEDPQYFNLTSGTTGIPKMYLLTQYNNSMIHVFIEQHDITGRDVLLTAFPIFGRVGFAWIVSGILSGARNVLHQFDPQVLPRLIESEKVTIFNLVPTMAAMMLAMPDYDQHDLSSLRGVVSAAAPLTSSLRDQIWDRLCPHIYEYYGLQELGIVVNSKPEQKRLKPDSVGQQAFLAEIRIVDPTGNDVLGGEVGEILGRAPAATVGYYKDEARTRDAFREGWFYTGDLGRFDEDGYLYLSGRVKDMIVTGGQNVFAIEVEDRLAKHPAVAECAVIGLPHETWIEMVTAVVVRKPGAEATEGDLMEHCRETLAGFKVPKRVFFSETPLPRTPTGKVTKYTLREDYS